MDEIINEGATAPLPDPEPAPQPATPEPASVEAAAPATEYAGYGASEPAPLYAAAPAAPSAPAVQKTYQVPARWLVIGLSVLAGLLILAATFGIGVKVGAHAGRFDRSFGGTMMQRGQLPDGQYPNGQNPHGWQDESDGYYPRGEGRGHPNIPGYGAPGRGLPRALPSPNATTQP